MPEELATRATLLLIGGIVAGAAATPLAAWLWRLATRLKTGQSFGAAVGLALFSACMVAVVLPMASVVTERRGHAVVQGELLEFVSVTLSGGVRGSRKRTGMAPVVAFHAADGTRHVIRGLAGSLVGTEPGTAVPVALHPQEPARSVIGDFQSLFAALGLFGIFTVLPLLAALHSAAQAVIDLREARRIRQRRPVPAPTAFERWRSGPSGPHWRAQFTRGALGTLVLGLGAVFVLAEFTSVGRALAVGMGAVASALAAQGVAAALQPPARPLMAFGGWAIGALGVGLFAAFLWTLTGPA
jgi:hypothetical protein